jgi:hypothetical protein
MSMTRGRARALGPLAVTVPVLLSASLLAGCVSRVAPPTGTPTVSPPSRSGTLVVTTVYTGGPNPGRASWPSTGQRVQVRDGARAVASGVSGADGRVSFTLDAGTYTVVCGMQSDPVSLSAGGRAAVDCIFPVP